MLINATVNSATPPAGDVIINITQRSASGAQVAPETIAFECDLSSCGFDDVVSTGAPGDIYDPTFHKHYYFWDFGESYAFTAPENVITGLNDLSGTAVGPQAAHTFRTVNANHTVTVSVWGYVSGVLTEKTGTLSGIDVGNPDTLFSTTNTIFVSTNALGHADFDQAPTGAQEVQATDIKSVYSTYIETPDQETVPKRIMLARGRSYTVTSEVQYGKISKAPTVHIVAGPTGGAGGDAKPILDCTTSGFSIDDTNGVVAAESKDFVLQNLDIRGGWDSSTRTGTSGTKGISNAATTHLRINNIMADGCLVSGFTTLVYTGGGTGYAPDAFMLNDCHLSNFGEMCIYMYGGAASADQAFFTCVGTRYGSAADAVVDTPSADKGHCMRGNSEVWIINKCDGYGAQADANASIHSDLLAMQGPLRPNSSSDSMKTVATQNYLECGWTGCLELKDGGGGDLAIINCMFDSNYCVLQAIGRYGMQISHSGVTARNSVFVQVACDGALTNGDMAIAKISGTTGSGNTEWLNGPVEIYSNTFVNLRSSRASVGANSYTDGPTDLSPVLQNNILHEPNISTDIGLNDGAPYYCDPHSVLGYREINGGASFTGDKPPSGFTIDANGHIIAARAPTSTCASFAPLTGSSAVGSVSTGLVSEFDMFGTRRKTIADTHARAFSGGAIEPNLAS